MDYTPWLQGFIWERVMIFLVRTIKQIDEKATMPTDFVIQAENEEEIKHIMNNAKVIVVGISVVPWRPRSGRIFAQVEKDGIMITCCVASDTVDHACERFVALWLPIIRIQTSDKSVSQEQSDQLIMKYRSIYEQQNEQEKEQKEEGERQEHENIDSEKQQRVIAIIGQTVQDIEWIEKEFWPHNIYREEIRQLHEIKEQLTKMKLGSNTEKSTLILEQAFSLMEKIEMSQINTMRQAEQQVVTNSIVSNIDIISELDKFKRAQEVNQAWMSQTTSDIYYTFFGISGLYQKFLAKDILQSLRQFQQSIATLIQTLHEWIFTILLTISILGMYRYHATWAMNPFVGELLIQYGIAAMISYIVLLFRRRNIIIVFLSLILAIVGVIIIQRLLIINLALM